VRTGGLRMNMKLMGPDEGGVVAILRIPRPSHVAAGASPSDVAFPFKSGHKGFCRQI
jgi:hypothetical protein